MTIILLSSFCCFSQTWYTDLNTVSYSFEAKPEHQTLWFRGLFTFETGVLEAWKKAVEKLRPATRTLLFLNSGGGNLFVLDYMKDLLKEACPNCEIVTYIPYKGQCSSACVAIFLMGDIKIMNNESYLGFHSSYHVGKSELSDSVKESLIIDEFTDEGSLASLDETYSVLQRWGVPLALLDYLSAKGSLETIEMELLDKKELELYAPGMVDIYLEDIYREFLNK